MVFHVFYTLLKVFGVLCTLSLKANDSLPQRPALPLDLDEDMKISQDNEQMVRHDHSNSNTNTNTNTDQTKC